MQSYDRLVRFIADAPEGTLVPVDSLRRLLDAPADSSNEGDRSFTPGEAAEWLHRHVGGRKRSAAAVRKLMRTGFRGVVLQSYLLGRERRTTEERLREFARAIGVPPSPRQIASAAPPTVDGHLRIETEMNHLDPDDEIARAQERFRRRPPRSQPLRRHPATG